ncbi:MAG: hypothetical protein XXXJIFNMEKO3_00150 [Candidatus Erwinia impunctatus]
MVIPDNCPPPVEDIAALASPAELYGVQQALSLSVVGDAQDVNNGLIALAEKTQADEIMINGQIFDSEARLRSFAMAMETYHAP